MPLTNVVATLPQAHTTLGEMLLDLTGDTTEPPQFDAASCQTYKQTTLACLQLVLNEESDQRKAIAAVRITNVIFNALEAARPSPAS